MSEIEVTPQAVAQPSSRPTRAPTCRNLPALAAFFVLAQAAPAAAPDGSAMPPPRIEARSADLLAVGIVHDGSMTVHVSRLTDNAPVRDAVLTVLLRGVTHPTTAEPDGSYTMKSKDLELPGSATVIFRIARETAREDIPGMLEVADARARPESKNGARQLWWWVLNFAVCIGFLQLWLRRNKAAPED